MMLSTSLCAPSYTVLVNLLHPAQFLMYHTEVIVIENSIVL